MATGNSSYGAIGGLGFYDRALSLVTWRHRHERRYADCLGARRRWPLGLASRSRTATDQGIRAGRTPRRGHNSASGTARPTPAASADSDDAPGIPTMAAKSRIAAAPIASLTVLGAVVAGGAAVILDRLADDGFLLRQQRGRLSKAEAVGAGGDDWRASAGQTFGIRASQADDLAATYGRLAFDAPQSTRNYVRIWRREATGWQLLVDLIN